jgi:ankyrin repeat protein
VRDSQDLNSRQEGGFTPLVSAAQNGSVELIQLLLAHGADLRTMTAACKTARDLAVESRHDSHRVPALTWNSY